MLLLFYKGQMGKNDKLYGILAAFCCKQSFLFIVDKKSSKCSLTWPISDLDMMPKKKTETDKNDKNWVIYD